VNAPERREGVDDPTTPIRTQIERPVWPHSSVDRTVIPRPTGRTSRQRWAERSPWPGHRRPRSRSDLNRPTVFLRPVKTVRSVATEPNRSRPGLHRCSVDH